MFSAATENRHTSAAIAAACVAVVSCGKISSTPLDGATNGSNASEDVYELNYSNLRSARGYGVQAGYHEHHAFTIDLAQKSRAFLTYPMAPAIDLLPMYDFGSCDDREPTELSRSAAELAPGPTTAWLEYIELDFTTDVAQFGPEQGACFGVRRADGKWEWHFDLVRLEMSGLGSASVRIPIGLDGVDAVKIAFSRTVPALLCKGATFKALPRAP